MGTIQPIADFFAQADKANGTPNSTNNASTISKTNSSQPFYANLGQVHVAPQVKPTPQQQSTLQQIGGAAVSKIENVIKGITFHFISPTNTQPLQTSNYGGAAAPEAGQSAQLRSTARKILTTPPQVGKPLQFAPQTEQPQQQQMAGGPSATMGPAPKKSQSIWDHITNWINGITGAKPEQGSQMADTQALAQSAYSVAKSPQAQDAIKRETGLAGTLPNGQVNPQALQVLATPGGRLTGNSPLENISKDLGIRDMPTNSEFTNMVLTASIGLGLSFAPLKTLQGLGIATGVGAVQTGFVKALTGGKGTTLSDLVPTDNPTIKNVIDALDFLTIGAATAGIESKSPALFDALTKDVISKYNLPETVVVKSEDLRGLGNQATNDVLKQSGITGDKLVEARKAALNSEYVTIPTDKVTQLVDKPYWGKLKGMLNLAPTDQTLGTTSGGASQGIAGLLPSGEATPKQVVDVVFQNNLQKTPEGEALMKGAIEAIQQRKNILIAKEEPTLNTTPTVGLTEKPIAEATPKEAQPITTTQAQTTPQTVNVENAGKTPSKVAISTQQKAIDQGLAGKLQLAGYDKITVKNQVDQARAIFSDPETARAIMRGEQPLPEGLNPASLIVAADAHIKATGDAAMAADLANSQYLINPTSVAGQTLRLLAEREPDSATAKLQQLKNAQIAKAGGEKIVAAKRQAVIKATNEALAKNSLTKEELSWNRFLAGIKC